MGVSSELFSSLSIWESCLILFVTSIIIYGFRPHYRWPLRHIPGRPPKWFWGNLMELRAGGPIQTHAKWAKEYGPVFTSFGGTRPFVFVDQPDLVRQVLLQNSSRPIFPTIWQGREREFDRASILAVSGDKHKSVRSAWQPMFFTGSLESYSALMNEATDILLMKLAAAAKETRVIDLYKLIGDMTLQVVGTTAFGVELHTQDLDSANKTMGVEEQEAAQHLRDAVASIFSVSVFAFSAYSPLIFLFPFMAPVLRVVAGVFPDKGLLNMKRARRVIVDEVAALIRQRRLVLAEEVRTDNLHKQGEESKGGMGVRENTLQVRKGVAPGSFLDLLMSAKDRTTGKAFTDLELANQAFIMMLAGYETTAAALSFTLFLLAAHPDKQQLLVEEVDRFSRDRAPGLEDLEGMPYLDACLKEALRLYPPAPTHIREAARDCHLGGYRIRKGQWLGCAVYSMHRNPKYWQDPERFLPERFLEGSPEYEEGIYKKWLPFGDGARACIGTRFALMEAKITLIRMYQSFTFELEPGQLPLKIHTTITIRPQNGVRVRAIPRTPSLQREP
ncbi:g6540 [Coccomyxa elongata]